MSEYIVKVEGLSKHYEVGGVTVKALDDVSVEIGRGKYVSIVGPSGSGRQLFST